MKNFTVVLPSGPGSDRMVTVAEGVQFLSGQVVVNSIGEPFFQVSLPLLPRQLPGFPANACLVWNPEDDGPQQDIPSNLNDRDWHYLISMVEAKAKAAKPVLSLRLRELLVKMRVHEAKVR